MCSISIIKIIDSIRFIDIFAIFYGDYKTLVKGEIVNVSFIDFNEKKIKDLNVKSDLLLNIDSDAQYKEVILQEGEDLQLFNAKFCLLFNIDTETFVSEKKFEEILYGIRNE